MSHRTRSRNLDYPRLAKTGFLLGAALFAVGAVGGIVGHAFLSSVPSVLYRLLFGMEILGVLVGFFAPAIFGVVMPLTE